MKCSCFKSSIYVCRTNNFTLNKMFKLKPDKFLPYYINCIYQKTFSIS